jgi:hypothetical protein
MGAEVSVSANIGSGNNFTLYGYTSPKAQVILEGRAIHSETIAQDNGYYSFNNTFSPITAEEVCISSIDTVGRLSNQVCLPPLPVNYNANIGPIILSPSISVNKGDVFIGQRVVLTGKTIPNTPVAFSFFKDEKKSLFTSFLQQIEPLLPTSVQRQLISLIPTNSPRDKQDLNKKLGGTLERASDTRAGLSEHWREGRSGTESNFFLIKQSKVLPIIKDVEAFTFPELKTISDKDGNYSIELPTSNQSFLRTFAQVQYQNSPSEKSRTLNIKVLPFWSIILTFISVFFKAIFGHIIITTFIIELLIILIYLKNHFFHPYYLAHNRVLMIYENKNLMIPEHHYPMRTEDK